MHIKSVRLTDLRGFKDLNFDFDRGDNTYAGWTVITGDNGSGKSTLLKALAVALTGKDTAQKLQPSFHRWLRDGCDNAQIEVDVVGHPTEDGLKEGGRPSRTFPVCLELTRTMREPTLEVAMPRGKPASYRTPQRTLWSQDAKGWFSCGYGPFRRVFGASQDATRRMVTAGTDRYATMFDEAASLAEVDVWLRSLHHKKLEKRPAESEQLGMVLQLLSDELLSEAISIKHIDSDGLWLADRNGVALSWGEMSDGYRSALALMADILRHMINSFGHEGLMAQDADGHLRIQCTGVVLIDEVDAHLHPSWQREIGFWLKRHFPNIQFIVTSHSPIICQAADRNGLFILPAPGGPDTPHRLPEAERLTIIAGMPDTILRSSAFGLENTRSPQAVDDRAELSRLNAKVRAGAAMSESESKRRQQLELFALADEAP